MNSKIFGREIFANPPCIQDASSLPDSIKEDLNDLQNFITENFKEEMCIQNVANRDPP